MGGEGMNTEYIVSKECIFFNPKDNKCHFIGFCEKLDKECPASERWGWKKEEKDTPNNSVE